MLYLGHKFFVRALFTWLVLLVFLVACTVQPTLTQHRQLQPPQSINSNLLPQNTFFVSRSLNPQEAASTGFHVQDLPLADGCSDGCLTNFNADLKWPAPAWQPQGATITLATFQEPTTAPASFYNYYFNVLETALNAQGIPFATKVRMDVGLHVLDTQVTNQRSTGILSLILSSIDGYNFNLDAPGSGNGHMTYNWGKANTTSFCEAGGSGNAIAMPATSAALTLNPTTQVGHLIAQYEGPMIYDYYNTYLPGNPYSCAYIGNQVGPASANLDVSFSVHFAPNPTPSPTPNPSSTPTPTPTPNGSATPSPIPTLLPPEKDLNCPPQISNEVDRLMRELERLQASIPGAPTLAGGTQGFSVKNVFINIAQRLFQLNVGLPSAQQATQIAIGAATGAVAVALANETALINEKAEIDRQFAEAVKNKNQSEKERLRNESNALNRLLQTASDLVRKAEQAKDQILQTSQKLAELSVKVDVLNRQTDTDCKEPTPSPSPTLIFPPTPSSTPTARPTPPGCFRDCSPDSDFPDSIDVIDKTGNIAISYSNEQCKEFEHSVAGQENPMRVFQDQGQIGDLDADCERTGTKLPHIRTNLDWMLDGYNPCDNSNTGKLTELHHFEQNPNGPIAEMSKDIHTRVSHPERPSRIDRDTFNDLRKAYWQTRGYQLKYGNDSTICRDP